MTSNTILQPLPTKRQLTKATLVSIVIAGAILVTTVLPAEHGIDPTGIGRALGLLDMSNPAAAPAPVTSTVPSAPVAEGTGPVLRNDYVVQSTTPFRTGEYRLTLEPNKGAEVKTKMKKGDQFTFSWSAGGPRIEFDMHGEEVNAAKDAFTSYWQGELAGGAGTFTAPFEGSHGWYWHNTTFEPVTVVVQVSGFIGELYRP